MVCSKDNNILYCYAYIQNGILLYSVLRTNSKIFITVEETVSKISLKSERDKSCVTRGTVSRHYYDFNH